MKEYSSKSSDRGVKSFIKCSSNLVLLTEEEKSKLEQRSKVSGKAEQARIAKRAKEAIRKKHGKKKR